MITKQEIEKIVSQKIFEDDAKDIVSMYKEAVIMDFIEKFEPHTLEIKSNSASTVTIEFFDMYLEECRKSGLNEAPDILVKSIAELKKVLESFIDKLNDPKYSEALLNRLKDQYF